MIESYSFSGSEIETCKLKGCNWLNLHNPTEEEIEFVGQKYNIPQWFFLEALDPKERPHYDQSENLETIIVRVPQKNSDNSISTTPISIIMANNILITICTEENIVKDLFQNSSLHRKYMWTTKKLAFKILKLVACKYIDILEDLEKLTNTAEKKLGKKQNTEIFLLLLALEKNLINVIVSLKTNLLVLKSINQKEIKDKEEKIILNSALIENEQAIFTAEIFSQTLSGISEALSNIVSNNLNYIMKLLTGVTIILMIPTIIVGLYGMNVQLPMQDYPLAFWLLCFGTIFVMIILALIFIRKNWM